MGVEICINLDYCIHMHEVNIYDTHVIYALIYNEISAKHFLFLFLFIIVKYIYTAPWLSQILIYCLATFMIPLTDSLY